MTAARAGLEAALEHITGGTTATRNPIARAGLAACLAALQVAKRADVKRTT